MTIKIKKTYLLLMLVFVCVSCKKEAYEHTVFLSKKDCKERIREAKKDIREGKLVLYENTSDETSLHERYNLFKEYGISYWRNDSLFGNLDFEMQCYCAVMREKIDEKFGSNFVDSIKEVVRKQLFAKYENNEDYFRGYEFDSYPAYPSENGRDLFIELDFELTYPAGYIKGLAENDHNTIEIHFEVDKNGDAKITKYPKIIFELVANRKYEDYFIKQIEKQIKKEGWTPAKIYGQNIKYKTTKRFYFK